MRSRKYTKEELSRILSAHSAGMLKKLRAWEFCGNKCCINQAAFNELFPDDAELSYGNKAYRVAHCFDEKYSTNMSCEELLHMIDKAYDEKDINLWWLRK